MNIGTLNEVGKGGVGQTLREGPTDLGATTVSLLHQAAVRLSLY